MRREYNFSQAIRNPFFQRTGDTTAEVSPLTGAQMRELDRRIKDGEDRTRYLLAAKIMTRAVLYYDVSDDVYAYNEPSLATLFKRRRVAAAVGAQLTQKVKVVKCRVTKKGKLIRSSLPQAYRKRSG